MKALCKVTGLLILTGSAWEAEGVFTNALVIREARSGKKVGGKVTSSTDNLGAEGGIGGEFPTSRADVCAAEITPSKEQLTGIKKQSPGSLNGSEVPGQPRQTGPIKAACEG